MVDRNGNGIPDDKERKPISAIGGRRTQQAQAPVVVGATQRGQSNPVGDFLNGAQSFGRNVLGPQLLGTDPAKKPAMPGLQGQNAWKAPGHRLAQGPADPAQPEKTLADYLQEAISMIGSQGGGVNFDPQRNMLRQNASEADARLEAMYRQLRGSIDADAPVIQQAYDQAETSTAQNAQSAQAQTQAASDSATARNDQVLANLGIQQASGNQIINGTDLATQTAGAVATQATKGQAAGDRLASNEATALQHNTNIGNAAGLEGNLQRAGNQSKLQALLAELDMQEQQQNASAGQNSFSQQLSLAQTILGYDQDKQDRQDQLQMSAAEQANSRYAAELKAQGQQLPDLGQYLQALGITPQEIAANPQKYGSLLSSLTKFGVTQ